MVILVPDDVSEAVRRFVEALFITHGETKLNTSGRLLHLIDQDDQYNNSSANSCPITYPMSLEAQAFDREEWCRDLTFPHQRRSF